MTPQIIEQSASTPDQLQQSPSGMMILLMKFEMIREIADTVRQDGDLDLRRPRIGIMLAILLDHTCLRLFFESHITPQLLDY